MELQIPRCFTPEVLKNELEREGSLIYQAENTEVGSANVEIHKGSAYGLEICANIGQNYAINFGNFGNLLFLKDNL